MLLVDERELRALVGGEMVDSSLAGPWTIWVIFALGLNMGVVGVMAGEGAFGGVERVRGGCGCGCGCGCGGEKRACIPAVEPTLAVRVRGNGEG